MLPLLLTRDDIGIHLTCELVVDGATWPCFSHTIDHPEGLVLVDTGMIESTPRIDELFQPTVHPLPDEVVQRVAHVIITHMHFDHHGANRLFPGIPIHVQRIELEDARTHGDEYTVPEWIDFPDSNYVEHDGEAEILPGIRIVPAPGETRGHQIVVVETDEGPVVLGGDVGHSFREVGQADTSGKRLVIDLAAPTYLAHVHEPHVPHLN
jgi:N-acyl homoserine lactone hydrolase